MNTLTNTDIPTFLPSLEESRLATYPVESDRDILYRYRRNAIGELLASHNLGRALPVTPTADLLIVTCMDHRVTLDIPESFAYQLRIAGATPRPVLSNVAFAVGVLGVRAICVIAHSDCTMRSVEESTDAMVRHLIEQEGWSAGRAEAERMLLHEIFGTADPVRSAWDHARHLADRFPSCTVAPLLYRTEDGALLQIEETLDIDIDIAVMPRQVVA